MRNGLRWIETRKEFKRLWQKAEYVETKLGLLHALRTKEYPEKTDEWQSGELQLVNAIDDLAEIAEQENHIDVVVLALDTAMAKCMSLPHRFGQSAKYARYHQLLKLLVRSGHSFRFEPRARRTREFLNLWENDSDRPDEWYDAAIATGQIELFNSHPHSYDQRVVERIKLWLESHLDCRKFILHRAIDGNDYTADLLKMLLIQMARCGMLGGVLNLPFIVD